MGRRRYMSEIEILTVRITFILISFVCIFCSSSSNDLITLNVDALQDDTISIDEQQKEKEMLECGVWLAPSTINGAGLGMFAGRYFQEREEILPTGDSIVSFIDFVAHTAANGKHGITFLWDEYTWNAAALLAGGDGRFIVTVASPGLGAAANSFLPIYNVDEWYPIKDSTGLHRSRDPGVGGFSLYHNRKSTAKYPIDAGQELFVSCKLTFSF